nr:hypothetical protein [Tanacetum cinerariifolium]
MWGRKNTISKVSNRYGITVTNRNRRINTHIKNLTKAINRIIKLPALKVDTTVPKKPVDPFDSVDPTALVDPTASMNFVDPTDPFNWDGKSIRPAKKTRPAEQAGPAEHFGLNEPDCIQTAGPDKVRSQALQNQLLNCTAKTSRETRL